MKPPDPKPIITVGPRYFEGIITSVSPRYSDGIITFPPQPPCVRQSRPFRLMRWLLIAAIPGAIWCAVELWRAWQ